MCWVNVAAAASSSSEKSNIETESGSFTNRSATSSVNRAASFMAEPSTPFPPARRSVRRSLPPSRPAARPSPGRPHTPSAGKTRPREVTSIGAKPLDGLGRGADGGDPRSIRPGHRSCQPPTFEPPVDYRAGDHQRLYPCGAGRPLAALCRWLDASRATCAEIPATGTPGSARGAAIAGFRKFPPGRRMCSSFSFVEPRQGDSCDADAACPEAGCQSSDRARHQTGDIGPRPTPGVRLFRPCRCVQGASRDEHSVERGLRDGGPGGR